MTQDLPTPGFTRPDPAQPDFQYLEELATAYWHSELLFAAIELELFLHLDQGVDTLEELAQRAQCKVPELERLMTGLGAMALVGCYRNSWYNAQVAARFLVPGKGEYMGDFFLYRKYMRPKFQEILTRVALPGSLVLEGPRGMADTRLTYEERNHLYVSAMDTLARQKAGEIADLLAPCDLSGRALDVGGGAGSLVRTLVRKTGLEEGVLYDLPEVIASARRLYPDSRDWDHLETLEGDFRSAEIKGEFDLVLLGNFLHAYGPEEARPLLDKAVSLLAPGGMLLIHDYFPDRRGASPQKGALYDLAMMLNTYNGACHTTKKISQWMEQAGMSPPVILDLSTDSGIMAACKDRDCPLSVDPWPNRALAAGLDKIIPIDPSRVKTSAFARTKCEFGCQGFGKNLQCPPRGMDHARTRELLDGYTRAYLVQGSPPGRDFHNQLLALEKQAFLEGFHKAFTLGAGPCPVCPSCPEDGNCRSPHLARPAMEASGIDVYETARSVGWDLEVVREKHGYVKYLGLLLLN